MASVIANAWRGDLRLEFEPQNVISIDSRRDCFTGVKARRFAMTRVAGFLRALKSHGKVCVVFLDMFARSGKEPENLGAF